VATAAGVDVAAVKDVVASGSPMENLRTEHSWLVEEFDVFGVPTFIVGDEAVFVRMMERHRLDDLERVLVLVDQPNINEFKRTRVPR
ncbi:MAG: DsbA family protein, partial [Acidimicrobiia bacterium]